MQLYFAFSIAILRLTFRTLQVMARGDGHQKVVPALQDFHNLYGGTDTDSIISTCLLMIIVTDTFSEYHQK